MRKPDLNKWNFVLEFVRRYDTLTAHEFTFGIFKLIHFPPEAETFSSRDYRGFILRFTVRLPHGFSIQLPREAQSKE